MTLQPANIAFDCADPQRVAAFWSDALARPIDPDATEHFASIGATDPATLSFFFAKVPEKKVAKNRCHVDLRTTSREAVVEEADRLVALGATLTRPAKEEFGVYWATLQDPEGNEFCIGAD